MNVSFCTATAGDRADQALVVMKSIRKIYPNANLYCDAIDFSGEQVQSLESFGVNVEQFSYNDVLPNIFDKGIVEKHADNHEKEKGYRPFEGVSLVCAAWRLHMIPRIIHATNAPIMWLDSDCIVRKNLDGFIQKCKRHDLAIHFRPGNPDHSKVLSSVFFANNTDAGYKFCDLLGPSYIEVREKVDWWADPYSLFLARRDFGGKSWNFPAKIYNDSRLADEAAIWHAKHSGTGKSKWKKAFKAIRREEI